MNYDLSPLGIILTYVVMCYSVIINAINLYRLFSLKATINAKYPDREFNLSLPQLKLYTLFPTKNKITHVSVFPNN